MVKVPQVPLNVSPPDPNIEAGRKHDAILREYNEELGKMIQMFSILEVAIFALLGSLLSVPVPIAKALFSDVRIDQAMNTAKRLVVARKEVCPVQFLPREAMVEGWLTYVFAQLAVINGIRNHIIHYGSLTSLDVENMVSSNWSRARTDDHLKELPVSADLLRQITTDGARATTLLGYVIGALTGCDFDDCSSRVDQEKAHPWLCKPLPQAHPKDKKPNKGPEQPPQPPPSPA